METTGNTTQGIKEVRVTRNRVNIAGSGGGMIFLHKGVYKVVRHLGDKFLIELPSGEYTLVKIEETEYV